FGIPPSREEGVCYGCVAEPDPSRRRAPAAFDVPDAPDRAVLERISLMAAPNTPSEFLDILRQSNLLEESDLERCRTLAGQAATAGELGAELVKAGILTPFHSTNLLRGRWRGFFLGKYRLLEQLGAGGMGQVFLATHQMMRRLVALKVLTLRPGADPSILPRFQREARAMAVLYHPHLSPAS